MSHCEQNPTLAKSICPHCDGQGYIEIRDCAGDIQREETCMNCGGTGEQPQPATKKDAP